uniref:Sugar phosphate transporter domain-containing protein n=1 Tax=Vespula pensylvanica TaxID=30213 RepID=A0A834UD63_VESPE|nr:hypothetical protein H0235_004626 [Vespula pensylvanica]
MDIENLSKYVYIGSVVAFYWIISILTVFVNKILLSSEILNLEAPLFVTWCQCIVSVVICIILSSLSICFPQYIKFPNDNPFKKETIKKILPLSILFSGMIISNNLSLKYIGIAFYYLGRSLTTVFNVIFTYTILGEKTSMKCIMCCGIIILGFWLGVDQENIAGSLSVFGTILGGICGFVIGYATALQIKVTSPLTHNVSGTAKACVQTVLATYWFDEQRSFLWWISNIIVLISSAAYARFRQFNSSTEYKKLKLQQKV